MASAVYLADTTVYVLQNRHDVKSLLHKPPAC